MEVERQRYVSFIYQNMEFETEESIGNLLDYVYENSFHDDRHPDLIPVLIDTCELQSVLQKKTQEVSKGELQRTIIAFSLLYGSKIIMMDEPIFALEDHQKSRIMDFLSQYSKSKGISLYYSVHELDISERYSDYIILFPKEGPPRLGPAKEILSRENIEDAFEVPYSYLKRREALFRQMLRGRRHDSLS
ncbi:Vitamin B12 import ATP-binding protein BtuD [subsurface metagenome]